MSENNVYHLPPMRRVDPTDAQRVAMQPLSERFSAMTDRSLAFTLTLLIEEMRRRRALSEPAEAKAILAKTFHQLAEELRRAGLDQVIVDRAGEIGLERMSGGDLDVIAGHMNSRDGLGGVA